MSLRKEKAARLKLAVLEQTVRLIGKKPFDDLYVEDICDKVKISKVTLFKYFATKEDILSYYFRVWCLRRVVELRGFNRTFHTYFDFFGWFEVVVLETLIVEFI